jgi:hypothetical protein
VGVAGDAGELMLQATGRFKQHSLTMSARWSSRFFTVSIPMFISRPQACGQNAPVVAAEQRHHIDVPPIPLRIGRHE